MPHHRFAGGATTGRAGNVATGAGNAKGSGLGASRGGRVAPEDAQVFMAEYGIQEPALNLMIRLSYDLLGLQSFFTVGEDEVRAWTTRRSASAVEAAGEIHTDIARGFVRAEVVAYDDLIELGSMAECKAKGKFRLEGKEYVVKDGDIVHIRSSI